MTWCSKLFFFVSRGHLRRNNFLFSTKSSKILFVFRLWGKHFGFLAKKKLFGLSKLFSSVQGIFSEEFVFENKFLELFLYFWSSGANFLDFRRKICDRFVKTTFYVSSGDFWLDCFFYENLWVISPSSGSEENFLAFWRKNIKKFVKTALYVYKKFLWKIWFLKKFLHFFRVLIKEFAHFRQKKLS